MSTTPEKKRGHRYFDHEADVGIEGFGTTLQEAFEEAALAMFNLIVNVGQVQARDSISVACRGADTEELFIEWLNALLAQADIHDKVFSEFHVQQMNGNQLSGFAKGETLDQDRHQPKLEVKAATYSMLSVDHLDDQWSVRCVVDV